MKTRTQREPLLRLCINQEDEEQRQRGIDGISGFLKPDARIHLSRLLGIRVLGLGGRRFVFPALEALRNWV